MTKVGWLLRLGLRVGWTEQQVIRDFHPLSCVTPIRGGNIVREHNEPAPHGTGSLFGLSFFGYGWW